MPRGADFDRVYEAYGPVVQRALRQLGVDPELVDDAAQDVFVVLHRRLSDYDRERSLTNWLWGIAKGVASTYRRSARRRERLHDALPSMAPSEPRTLEDHVARRQATRVLQDFLASLDTDKCAVFVLAEIEGCTGPEIAERLSVNLNTVYARLRAARRCFDDAVERHRPTRLQVALGLFAWPFGKTAAASGACVLAAALVVPAIDVPEIEDEEIAILDEPAPTRMSAPPAKEVAEESSMKSRTLAAVAITGMLTTTVAAPAAAKKPKAGSEWIVQDADEAAHKGDDGTTRIYEFDNDHVGGESLSPDGTILMQRPPTSFGSLIHIRPHFMAELVQLANDV
jgi:RNA polymerase sigma-70 factor (ECF subfamily)